MSNTGSAKVSAVSPTIISSQVEAAGPPKPDEARELKDILNADNTEITVPQLPEKSKGKICGVCTDHEARYKCSRCQLPYCSVACATLHRATHPAVSDDVPPINVKDDSSIIINKLDLKHVPGTVLSTGIQNPFSLLEDAQELQTLFIMYPRLRSQLREIYNATLPPLESHSHVVPQYEIHPQSYRGRGRGRGKISKGSEKGPWNLDRGTQDGIDALCNAKEQYGKSGEGIREYAELVLKLISIRGVDVAQLIQEEVAEENEKIIAQLLNGDSF